MFLESFFFLSFLYISKTKFLLFDSRENLHSFPRRSVFYRMRAFIQHFDLCSPHSACTFDVSGQNLLAYFTIDSTALVKSQVSPSIGRKTARRTITGAVPEAEAVLTQSQSLLTHICQPLTCPLIYQRPIGRKPTDCEEISQLMPKICDFIKPPASHQA